MKVRFFLLLIKFDFFNKQKNEVLVYIYTVQVQQVQHQKNEVVASPTLATTRHRDANLANFEVVRSALKTLRLPPPITRGNHVHFTADDSSDCTCMAFDRLTLVEQNKLLELGVLNFCESIRNV